MGLFLVTVTIAAGSKMGLADLASEHRISQCFPNNNKTCLFKAIESQPYSNNNKKAAEKSAVSRLETRRRHLQEKVQVVLK